LEASFRHPIPGEGLSRSSWAETRKGIVLSSILHITLALVGWTLISSQSIETPTATTHLYDIEVVPLSALETNLPKGDPAPKPPEATKPEQSKPRPIERVKEPTVASPESSNSNSPKQPVPARAITLTDSTQPLGSPDGDATSAEQARINYQDMVASLLARAKRYPERALRRRMTGDATIRIEIAADGSLSEFNIIRSTDSPILDEELKAMVDRASPFPPFPPDLQKRTLALVVPVTFKLDS
jgi:protein TonB